jgi:hypothetical protein
MTRHAETRTKNQRPNLPKNRQRAFPVRLIHIYPQGTSALWRFTGSSTLQSKKTAWRADEGKAVASWPTALLSNQCYAVLWISQDV